MTDHLRLFLQTVEAVSFSLSVQFSLCGAFINQRSHSKLYKINIHIVREIQCPILVEYLFSSYIDGLLSSLLRTLLTKWAMDGKVPAWAIVCRTAGFNKSGLRPEIINLIFMECDGTSGVHLYSGRCRQHSGAPPSPRRRVSFVFSALLWDVERMWSCMNGQECLRSAWVDRKGTLNFFFCTNVYFESTR